MGQDGGFLKYQRKEDGTIQPLDRISRYTPFHTTLASVQRQEQAARCMNCGAPFCQSATTLHGMVTGCPLHNLIPEWNDELYRGNEKLALQRLLLMNPLPEFTGRVCPALCEKACLCGVNEEPVTVKDNELAIIEAGYEQGLVQPAKVEANGKKVAVVGSGPAGLAAAETLHKLGYAVEVFEKSDRAGGLLMYGIPNMKLEKQAVERRIALMQKEGILFHLNADVGKNVSARDLEDEFDAVILAGGAKQARSIAVPGLMDTQGVYYAVDFLTSTTKALLNGTDDYISAQGKHVVIVGGGDTGNDCVGTCMRHGCASVLQLEMMPCPPVKRTVDNPWPEWPKVLKTDYGQEEAIAMYGKDPRIYETTVVDFAAEKDQLKSITTAKVKLTGGKMEIVPGSEEVIPCELLIIAAGFIGSEKYTAEAFNAPLSNRSRIITENNSYHVQNNLFTAGDIHRGQSLVVWAIREGRDCALEVDAYMKKEES